MGTLRGFGVTFDLAFGCMRNWYIDGEGAKRWADNDELVQWLPGQQQPATNGDGGRKE
jgi:hypothetical protein